MNNYTVCFVDAMRSEFVEERRCLKAARALAEKRVNDGYVCVTIEDEGGGTYPIHHHQPTNDDGIALPF